MPTEFMSLPVNGPQYIHIRNKHTNTHTHTYIYIYRERGRVSNPINTKHSIVLLQRHYCDQLCIYLPQRIMFDLRCTMDAIHILCNPQYLWVNNHCLYNRNELYTAAISMTSSKRIPTQPPSIQTLSVVYTVLS